MRLGILGGSFDPPHTGHLLVAQDAVSALGLDRLLVVPTAKQPLKGYHTADTEHRLAMTRACFAGIDGIEVDPIEIERGGLSFMVDTVEAVKRRWPHADLHLLIGSDVVPTLHRWHAVDRLLQLVQLVVLTRDRGSSGAVRETGEPGGGEAIEYLEHPNFSVEYLATRRVDISSTEIRARVRDGRSIRGFVPDDVATYIVSNGLYIEYPRDSVDAEHRNSA